MGRRQFDSGKKARTAETAVEDRWVPRTRLSWLIRTTAVLVPIVASVAAGTIASRLLPAPDGVIATLAWYGVLAVLALATLIAVDRLARRLLPLAMLLRLSLVFPDRAPSRMAIALRAGNARRLQGCLDEARRGTTSPTPILTLAAALNAHDRRTRGHSDRVRALTDLVAEEMRLSESESERLRWAAFLHDVGKLTVPAKVLNKNGGLSPKEWKTVHRHPERGEELAAPLSEWMGEWIHGIGEHHEHYDGTGYPRGLAGDDITLAGRIVAVTDAFETMTALRSYNRPMTPERAREELTHCAGKHFDPRVVRSFLSISIGRLRWTVGAAAWLAQLPFLGVPARASAQLVTSAVGTELTMVPVVGMLAVSVAGIATPVALDLGASASGEPEQIGAWSPPPERDTTPRAPRGAGSDAPGLAAFPHQYSTFSYVAVGTFTTALAEQEKLEHERNGPGNGVGGPGQGSGPGNGAGQGRGGPGQGSGPGNGAGQGGGLLKGLGKGLLK